MKGRIHTDTAFAYMKTDGFLKLVQENLPTLSHVVASASLCPLGLLQLHYSLHFKIKNATSAVSSHLHLHIQILTQMYLHTYLQKIFTITPIYYECKITFITTGIINSPKSISANLLHIMMYNHILTIKIIKLIDHRLLFESSYVSTVLSILLLEDTDFFLRFCLVISCCWESFSMCSSYKI